MGTLSDNPIGIYEKALPDYFEWAQKIEAAQRAGYHFIEMSIDESDSRLERLEWSQRQRQELKTLLETKGFHIRSLCLSGHRRFPFGSKNPAIRQCARDMMDKAILLAADLGIRTIQLAGYDVYYEEADAITKELFIEGLQYAASQAARHSMMLSIEIMDTELIGTITRCLEYIHAVQSPWLQIYPDLGNLSQWTDAPEQELETGLQHIVAVHLKDTKPGVFKCVPFGQGTVRFEPLFKKLKTLHYTGPFLVEMWADNTGQTSLEACVEEIQAARQWLQNKMEAC